MALRVWTIHYALETTLRDIAKRGLEPKATFCNQLNLCLYKHRPHFALAQNMALRVWTIVDHSSRYNFCVQVQTKYIWSPLLDKPEDSNYVTI